MGDFIVVSLILLVVVTIIYRGIKRRKNGQGGCSGCPSGSSCMLSADDCQHK